MLHRTLSAAICAGALLTATASGQQPPQGERQISLDRSFSIRLPAGWRQLTPDEARTLSKRPRSNMPADLLTPRTPAYYPYGDVDRWLHSGFDGRCMTVAQVDGEPPEGDRGLAAIREKPGGTGSDRSREIQDAHWSTLADDHDHPLIECHSVLHLGRGSRPIEALQLLIPTGGNTLILGFWAWQDEFARALPEFRAAAATIHVARPARGPRKLSDQLFYPAVIGALVGLLLLVLRRRPPG